MQRRNFTKIICSISFIPLLSYFTSKEIDKVAITLNRNHNYRVLDNEEFLEGLEIYYKDGSKRVFISEKSHWYNGKKNKDVELKFVDNDILFNQLGVYIDFKNVKEIYSI